ncbi:YdeI/OmpD-associated family protein [uncultured Cytophaga sp.]|uniref:YdeI/OmpD-associated family protein n=1 Tax=uncultured Cytophaga sp. TaxID=160238 RepID=UPI00260B79B9|nr:YdeI/OmpD-associated family protein [uncultured Cytophaga sp.]
MEPTFFKKQSDFRKWLVKNHSKETELIVGFYKVGSGIASMSWSESVDEALCFGWIDAVRKSIDHDSYQIRFTKRKPNSIWSAVNIRKMGALTKAGLMQPAGLEIFKNKREHKSNGYSHGDAEIPLSIEFEKQFKLNKKAWDYFQLLAPSYRKPSTKWVMSAKQESTQLKRLNKLIGDCAAGTNMWRENKYTSKKKTK